MKSIKKFIYIIRSPDDYDNVVKIIEENVAEKSAILQLSYSYPYFMDDLVGKKYVVSWSEMGVSNAIIRRYWMNNYKELGKKIAQSMEVSSITDASINNDYFLFEVVWSFGSKYIDVVDSIQLLFEKNTEKKYFIVTSPKCQDTFVDQVVFDTLRYLNVSYEVLAR